MIIRYDEFIGIIEYNGENKQFGGNYHNESDYLIFNLSSEKGKKSQYLWAEILELSVRTLQVDLYQITYKRKT